MVNELGVEQADLLSRVALGDRSAFESLYQQTSVKLYPVLLRITKREDLAQECMQDAYVSIWNRAGEFQLGKASPITWMTSIARYRALDLLRKRKHETSFDDRADENQRADSSIDLERDVSDREVAGTLGDCLKGLEERQRMCIYFAYYDGLTHAEIAEQIDVPIGSVKTWIRRGMQKLKGCMSS